MIKDIRPIILLVSLLIFVISCTGKKNKKGYYKNGKIKFEMEMEDAMYHGRGVVSSPYFRAFQK